MKQIFNIDLPAQVWQIRLDGEKGWIAIECRNPVILQTSFSVVDSRTGAFLLSDFKTKEPWYTGVEDICTGILFLHGIGDRRFGSHQGITAVGVSTGTILWHNPTYVFYGLLPNQVLAKEVNPEGKIITFNILTGDKSGGEQNIGETNKRLKAYQEQRQSPVKMPQHYPESSSYFGSLQKFLEQKTSIKAVKAIDYLETNNFFILGFYCGPADEELNYFAAVFTITGELLLKEKLATNLKGIGLDSFFILQETLILIKNKETLLGFEL